MSSDNTPSVFSITADVARERTAAAKARIAEEMKTRQQRNVERFVKETVETVVKDRSDAGGNEVDIELPVAWNQAELKYFGESLTNAGYTFEYPQDEYDYLVCHVKW